MCGHNVPMARVLLGVTGGIAAYKACELARLLVRAGHEVTPILTPEAETFVSAKTFEALARREAPRELYPHLVEADVLVVAPLSANTLAKLAQGLADNVLTQTALAFEGPVVAAPAMNPRMWRNAATRANVEALVARGVELVGPEEGDTAEGEVGVGRMSEPEQIFERVVSLLEKREQLRGRRVLVTAGGTREPLDSVRYVGNRSSGRMGVALASAAWRRGATVDLIAGPLSVSPPSGPQLRQVETTAEMAAAVEELVPSADVLIMAAAPADFRPAQIATSKIKKRADAPVLALEHTTDILKATLARRRGDTIVVGFALETNDTIANARAKLASKGVDMIVLNDATEAGAGFGVDTNRVTLLMRDGGEEVLPLLPKADVADAIDRIEQLVHGR